MYVQVRETCKSEVPGCSRGNPFLWKDDSIIMRESNSDADSEQHNSSRPCKDVKESFKDTAYWIYCI